jgi:hypothetical protein
MKIIDVLLFEQIQGLFEEFAQRIPVQKVEDSRFQVYRLEIDPMLVIFFYLNEMNNKMPAYLVENIGPSLKRIIWLLDDQQTSDLTTAEGYGSIIKRYDDLIPSAVVLRIDESKSGRMPENLINKSLYLGDHSRLHIWNEAEGQDSLRIWKSIWTPSDLPAGMNTANSA